MAARQTMHGRIARAAALIICAAAADAQNVSGAPLRLVQTIPLPGVEGRIDHLAVDLPGRRLFVCALGNNTLEVIDLERGARVHSISGLGTPQGVAYVPEPSRLCVANDKDGICNFYDGRSFALLGSTNFEDDADNMRYDGVAKRIYVGFGSGGIGILDAATGKKIGAIKLSGHPEAFVLEKQGPRIFVNVPTAKHVAVVDRGKGGVIATWKTDGAFANFPMALDESNHRLFIGCRLPAKIVVLNTESAAVVTSIGIAEDTDDIFYDLKRHRVYAVCGGGELDVIEQVDPDNYKLSSAIPTAAGARAGLFVAELNSLFVAVPHRGNQKAEVRRYSVD
jgi:DNA-binding beta-propeller fold protein YncE